MSGKPPESTPGERIAQLSGLIAGLPDEFSRAVKAIDEIKRRSAKALEYGLLNESRAKKIIDISAEVNAVRETFTECWKIADGIISAGITLPEEEIEL